MPFGPILEPGTEHSRWPLPTCSGQAPRSLPLIETEVRSRANARAVKAAFPGTLLTASVADFRGQLPDLPALDGLVAANSLHFVPRSEQIAVISGPRRAPQAGWHLPRRRIRLGQWQSLGAQPVFGARVATTCGAGRPRRRARDRARARAASWAPSTQRPLTGHAARLGLKVGSSNVLVAPGVRTEVASGWRADVATIVGTIRAHPQTLVLGMIGFALRGGIIFLTVPIIVLPTSVEVRLLLGSGLGPSGLTSDFYVAAGLLSVLTLGLALLVLYVLARCETGSVRAVRQLVAAERRTRLDVAGPPRRRGAQPAVLAHVRCRNGDADRDSSRGRALGRGDRPVDLRGDRAAIVFRFVVRANLNDVSLPLIVFIASIVVIEAVSAIVTRRILAGAFGLRAANRLARHPFA